VYEDFFSPLVLSPSLWDGLHVDFSAPSLSLWDSAVGVYEELFSPLFLSPSLCDWNSVGVHVASFSPSICGFSSMMTGTLGSSDPSGGPYEDAFSPSILLLYSASNGSALSSAFRDLSLLLTAEAWA